VLRFTVLGGSPAWPNPGQAASGYLVETDRVRMLVDCGSGVATELRAHDPGPLTDIVISHFHADHWFDLVPLHYAHRYGSWADRPEAVTRVPNLFLASDFVRTHTDLATMLVMEFAMVYSNDWFQLSVPVTAGSLVQVGSLVVTDTFGVPTTVGPASAAAAPGQSAWSMFTIGNGRQRLEPLFLPPVLGAVLDGPVLEEVLFLRDEMAAMGWAVEQQIQGPMDQAVDGYEAWRLRLIADPPPAVRPAVPGGPPVYYLLETTVPDNWIPLVPVLSPAGDLFFRRGLIERPSAAGPVPVLARSVILDPGQPFFVYDQSVPRAGADVTRRFRRARWTGGATQTWLARATRPGRGPGWSGLAFDLVAEAGQPPPEIQP